MALPYRRVDDDKATLNFESVDARIDSELVGPTGPTGPEGDPGIVIAATAPADTDVLWADTTEPGDVGIGPTGPSGPSGPTGPMAPTGAIVAWPTNTPPTGWVLCDGLGSNGGAGLSTTTYAALYAVIGDTYGGYSGTFFPPDLRTRTIVGRSSGDADFGNLNDKPGARTHTLTSGEIPAHNHAAGTLAADSAGTHNHEFSGNRITTNAVGGSGGAITTLSSNAAGDQDATTTSDGAHTHNISGSTANTGGGGAHNNIQPSIVLNYIIKT